MLHYTNGIRLEQRHMGAMALEKPVDLPFSRWRLRPLTLSFIMLEQTLFIFSTRSTNMRLKQTLHSWHFSYEIYRILS